MQKHWHQTAVQRAKESVATLAADRAAIAEIVQQHLESTNNDNPTKDEVKQ